jgi:lysophospholipase L1-like esterase
MTMTTRNVPVLGRAVAGLRFVAIALAIFGVTAAASAKPPAVRGNDGFLALGDSVVFGYITQSGFAFGNAGNFIGYPAYVGAGLRFDVSNASCPGETTAGFIDMSGADNGCRPYRQNFPLHVQYASTQLDYALNYLATHKQTRLVTLGLGANDAFLVQAACAGDAQCIEAALPSLLATIYGNVSAILSSIRATGYRGVLIVVNYYSLDYADPVQTGFTVAINQYLSAAAAANGAVVADVFSAWQAAALLANGATCMTGLLNPNPANQWTCDVHPSQTGQQLIAKTVAATYLKYAKGHH